MTEEKKKTKNLKVARILTEFVLTKYREMNEKQLENEIFQMEKDEEELLIEEISKKITNHMPIQTNKEGKINKRRNTILFDKNDLKSKKIRNVEAIYLTLLKFKGLKRYMNYQGLCAQDIRNISCYIKHQFYPKGSYIVRQYDKSTALYGIINGSCEVREIETFEKTKNIALKISNDNGEDDEEMEKIFKKIPYDYFLSDNESDNDDNDNDNDNNDDNDYKENERNYVYGKYKEAFIIRRKIKKRLKTVKNISPLKDIKMHKKNSNLLKNKRNSIFNNIGIVEHQTPEKIEGSILEYFKLDFEEKRVTLKKGMCVGEWGIVYNIPRTTSIYCPEDTHIFYLEKKYFNKILLNKFLEGDMKKVQFILDRIPIFKKDLKIRNLLTKIPPEFYEKNHIVYTPFDDANTIYLVYKGECILGELPFIVNNKKDYLNKFDQIKTLSFLDEGGIAGLESSQGYEKYKHCLIIKKEFTILLKLNVDYLKKIYIDFCDSIYPLFVKQNSRIEEFKNESLINRNKSKIQTHILNDKIKELKKELDKPYKIKKENLLKLNKKILNNEKILSLANRTNIHFPSFSNPNKKESSFLTQRESSKLNLCVNPYNTFSNSSRKRFSKKIHNNFPNIYNVKLLNTLSNQKTLSTEFNTIDYQYYEKKYSENSSFKDYNLKELKRKKATYKDIVSELKLPKKLNLDKYFGRNKSYSGHYNIAFINNLA